MNPEQPGGDAPEPITFCKVMNRESHLIYQGDKIVGRVECPLDAESWTVIIDPDPGNMSRHKQDGFKSASKAREWAKGFFAGASWVLR